MVAGLRNINQLNIEVKVQPGKELYLPNQTTLDQLLTGILLVPEWDF